MKPTPQTYSELQAGYDYFNKFLFGGALPPCLITYQRKSRAYGFFCEERWESVDGKVTDEIALNPVHFKDSKVEDILGTLVHEMVHLWQHHFGKPGRGRYHNKEWVAKMEEVGLVPSDTGRAGGKKTGDRVSHYAADGGVFLKGCKELIKRGFVLTWEEKRAERAGGSAPGGEGAAKQNTRTKYSCPECGLNAWAKPKVSLHCGTCHCKLKAQKE